MNKTQIKVGVIGSGTIGTDLVERMLRDSDFDVRVFIGRRENSPGLQRFRGKIPKILHNGQDDLASVLDELDGVFDATSAFDHINHWNLVKASDKWIIDLTPSKIGVPIVPSLINKVNEIIVSKNFSTNYSMVTCGGQSSAPIVQAICSNALDISEVEVSSSIAALSAGPATRLNIDEYIYSTRNLVSLISGVNDVKVILVLNPADPPVMMRTTVQVSAKSFNLSSMLETLENNVNEIRRVVPGFNVSVKPYFSQPGVISCTAKIEGAGYFLPKYAGNLDIINAAAVEMAKIHTRKFRSSI